MSRAGVLIMVAMTSMPAPGARAQGPSARREQLARQREQMTRQREQLVQQREQLRLQHEQLHRNADTMRAEFHRQPRAEARSLRVHAPLDRQPPRLNTGELSLPSHRAPAFRAARPSASGRLAQDYAYLRQRFGDRRALLDALRAVEPSVAP